jgi:hypothetical protein
MGDFNTHHQWWYGSEATNTTQINSIRKHSERIVDWLEQYDFPLHNTLGTYTHSLASQVQAHQYLTLLSSLVLTQTVIIIIYCPYATLGYERPTPSLTDINIHSDTQAEPRKLSSLTLHIDLWQEGKPAPYKTLL